MLNVGDTAPDFTVPIAGGEVYNDIEEFTLSEDGQEVTMDVPVSYDRYTSNMSLPDFSFENVTER